jgi:hypothetical protein
MPPVELAEYAAFNGSSAFHDLRVPVGAPGRDTRSMNRIPPMLAIADPRQPVAGAPPRLAAERLARGVPRPVEPGAARPC